MDFLKRKTYGPAIVTSALIGYVLSNITSAKVGISLGLEIVLVLHKPYILPCNMYNVSETYDETVYIHRLVYTVSTHICNKYQYRMTWLNFEL